MMDSDIHGPKTTHGKTANGSMLSISQGTIVLVNIADQFFADRSFNKLCSIEAISPFAGHAWQAVAIGHNQDQFGDTPHGNEHIGRCISLTSNDPISCSAGRTMQEVEHGVTLRAGLSEGV